MPGELHERARDRHADPNLRFTYWGSRSYSAEFYTQGAVKFTDRTATFETLDGNGRRDAVAIPQKAADDLAPVLGSGFDRVGVFNDRVLFIGTPAQEAAS